MKAKLVSSCLTTRRSQLLAALRRNQIIWGRNSAPGVHLAAASFEMQSKSVKTAGWGGEKRYDEIREVTSSDTGRKEFVWVLSLSARRARCHGTLPSKQQP